MFSEFMINFNVLKFVSI